MRLAPTQLANQEEGTHTEGIRKQSLQTRGEN